MGFPRQEYWSGESFHFPGDLPDPDIKPVSPAWQADSLPPEPPENPLFMPLAIMKARTTFPQGVTELFSGPDPHFHQSLMTHRSLEPPSAPPPGGGRVFEIPAE